MTALHGRAFARGPRGRSLVPFIIAATGIVIVALVWALYSVASQVDLSLREREQQLVEAGLQQRIEAIEKIVLPQTLWDEAVANLDHRYDQDWAKANIGQYLTQTSGFEHLFILDADGVVRFAFEDGAVVPASAFGEHALEVQPLVQEVRRREAARGPFVQGPPSDTMVATPIEEHTIARAHGEPFILSASLVQPDFGTAVSKGLRAPIVIVGETVDASFLASVSRQYLVEDLRVEPGVHTRRDPRRVYGRLMDSEGRVAGLVSWRLKTPVTDLAKAVAPAVALVLLLLVLIPAYLIRTERRRMAELKAASEEVRAAAEAKGQFVANMTHEIRTPMNAVLGIIHLLEREPLRAEARDLLERAAASGQLLQRLLDDVIDLSKIEEGKLKLDLQPTDPAAVLAGVVTLLRPQAEDKGLALRLEYDGEVEAGWVLADSTRIGQILFNLIGNAVKFTLTGEVVVRLAAAHSADDGARRLRFEVQDTGVGVPDGVEDRLFNRFVQADGSTSRRFGGSGLGLSISERLVTLMHGQIGYTSLEGQGSTFWFEIPAASAAEPATAEAAHSDEALAGAHILLVDDNPTNRLVASRILETFGALVSVAEDGAQALDAVTHTDFDLVLMDVQMPVMDGVEATRRIRALGGRYQALTIVGLTANALTEQKAGYLAAGMDEVIAKPIVPAELYGQLQILLGRRLTEAAA